MSSMSNIDHIYSVFHKLTQYVTRNEQKYYPKNVTPYLFALKTVAFLPPQSDWLLRGANQNRVSTITDLQ